MRWAAPSAAAPTLRPRRHGRTSPAGPRRPRRGPWRPRRCRGERQGLPPPGSSAPRGACVSCRGRAVEGASPGPRGPGGAGEGRSRRRSAGHAGGRALRGGLEAAVGAGGSLHRGGGLGAAGADAVREAGGEREAGRGARSGSGRCRRRRFPISSSPSFSSPSRRLRRRSSPLLYSFLPPPVRRRRYPRLDDGGGPRAVAHGRRQGRGGLEAQQRPGQKGRVCRRRRGYTPRGMPPPLSPSFSSSPPAKKGSRSDRTRYALSAPAAFSCVSSLLNRRLATQGAVFLSSRCFSFAWLFCFFAFWLPLSHESSFTSALFSPTPKPQNYKKKEKGKTRTRALFSPSLFARFETKQCDSPSLSLLRSASRSHPWYVFLHALAAIEKLNMGPPHALALWNCKDDRQLRLTPGAPGAPLPHHFAAESGRNSPVREIIPAGKSR